MNKKLSKFFAFALTSAMGMALAAPAFFANAEVADPSTADKGKVSGSKTLKVIDLKEKAEFEFTLEGDADAAKASGMTGNTVDSVQYFPGIVENVTGPDDFDDDDGTFNLTFDPATDTAFNKGDDGYKYYRQAIDFDFSAVDWKYGAGMYVYTIKETNSGGYKQTSDEAGYKIYVYVENDTNPDGSIKDTDGDGDPDVKIGGVIVTDEEGNKKGGGSNPDDNEEYTPDPNNPGGGTGGGSGSKFESKGDFDFWNEKNANVLTLSKKVTGNQASTTKEFAFKITLKGDKGTYDITGDIANGDSNAGNNKTYITIGDDGTGEGIIYLKNKENAKIYIPNGVQWEIEETVAGYTASATIDSENANDTDESPDTYTVKGTMGNTAQAVEFTNELSGTIPTGVLLTVAPFAALTLVGLGGAAVVLKKKKNEDEE